MKINGHTITATSFAFDGCHKIYLIESEKDLENARQTNYLIFPIKELEEIYHDSCPLKFINTWNLESIVEQGKEAIFKTLTEN